jgi:hypothetical protein
MAGKSKVAPKRRTTQPRQADVIPVIVLLEMRDITRRLNGIRLGLSLAPDLSAVPGWLHLREVLTGALRPEVTALERLIERHKGKAVA